GKTLLKIHYNGGDGNDVVLSAVDTAVRIAPTFISPDGKTAKFHDLNGDTIAITTDKGRFTPKNFNFIGYAFSGEGKLHEVDLSFAKSGNTFQGANITARISKAGLDSPDGLVHLEHFKANGVDLRSVKIVGNLYEIDAGDSNVSTPGLGALKVYSFGYRPVTSTIVGRLRLVEGRATREHRRH